MRILRRLGALSCVVLVLVAQQAFGADQPITRQATLASAQALPPWGVLPTLVEGGFSGLYPVDGAPGQFWTVSDRGPNGDTFVVGEEVRRPFLSPVFTPSIYRIAIDGTAIRILQRIPLKLRHGFTNPLRSIVGGPVTHLTGFGNTRAKPAANIPVADEIPTTDTDNDGDVDASDGLLPLDPYGVDTEGIVWDKRSGTFWVVEEYRPSILQVAADGTVLQRITPKGQNVANLGPSWGALLMNDVLPAEYSFRRDNRGFEGVAISADGLSLYAIMQNPLATSCSGTDAITGTPFVSNNNRSATRIAKLDISHPFGPKLAGDFIYTLDTNASGNALNSQLRISDLFWVGPDRLLVDERDDTAGVAAQGQTSTTTKHLYEINLAGATNVQSISSQARNCLDALRPAGVAGRGVTVGVKTSVLDLGSTLTSPEYPFAKLEGIVKLPNGNFATVNDNDFEVGASAGIPTRYIEYGNAAP